ncbi:MAG: Sugar phosphatase YidA [Chloroflexi bacterium ADurb.Bin325]|nr:MAG: Sugar phosphatase YidA [Chloroflexi bacterium ADurb.Bin325]
MTVRLLAFDYDGTAAMDGGLPRAAVCEAVARAQARGVRVVLATGRTYASALPYARALGLRDPLICYQGAMVRELAEADPHTLLVEPLPEEPLAEALAHAEAAGLDLTLYDETAMYYAVMRRPQEFYDRWFGMPMRRVPSLPEAIRQIRAAGSYPIKGLYIAEATENDQLVPDLRARFGDRLSVVRSHDLFAELISPAASKGRALAHLAQLWGIPRSETMAVGDSGNDASMIEWAGVGVAMGNASHEALAVADWVAPPVAEDGLAAAIDRYVAHDGRG